MCKRMTARGTFAVGICYADSCSIGGRYLGRGLNGCFKVHFASGIGRTLPGISLCRCCAWEVVGMESTALLDEQGTVRSGLSKQFVEGDGFCRSYSAGST